MPSMPPKTSAPAPQAPVWRTWEARARGTLVEAMAARQLSYKELARALEREKVFESARQLNRKVNRGKFSTAFWLACMRALDMQVQVTPRPPIK